MSPMRDDAASDPGQQPTEEELRAAYEAEMRNLRIEHLLLEHVVAMVSLGMRRTGISPGTESERDPDQVRVAIESIRALMPLLEQNTPEQVGQIRSALSQLQLAFVKIGGQQAGEASTVPSQAQGEVRQAKPEPAEPPKPGEAGPAQRSGRLWVPGQ
ncbi:MAG: hypothetical protein ACR2L9_01075 [Solirubrobacteraceae bacterium]